MQLRPLCCGLDIFRIRTCCPSSEDTSIYSSGSCDVDTSIGVALAAVVQKFPGAAQTPVLCSRQLEHYKPLHCRDVKVQHRLCSIDKSTGAAQASVVQTSPGAAAAPVA